MLLSTFSNSILQTWCPRMWYGLYSHEMPTFSPLIIETCSLKVHLLVTLYNWFPGNSWKLCQLIQSWVLLLVFQISYLLVLQLKLHQNPLCMTIALCKWMKMTTKGLAAFPNRRFKSTSFPKIIKYVFRRLDLLLQLWFFPPGSKFQELARTTG